jgi:hypothetical protein
MLEGDADFEARVEGSSRVYGAAALRFRRSVTWLRGLGRITTIPAISQVHNQRRVQSHDIPLQNVSGHPLHRVG